MTEPNKTRDEILKGFQPIFKKHGDYQGQNIKLKDGSWLFEYNKAQNYTKTTQIIQIIKSVFGESLFELNVLDLACLTGYFSISLAQEGVGQVTGIEFRENNIVKGEYLKNALNLNNLSFQNYDLRDGLLNILGTIHGYIPIYDIILMAGILYHLDLDYGVKLLDEASSVCTKLLYLSTHTMELNNHCVEYKNQKYYGTRIDELAYKKRPDSEKKECWMGADSHAIKFSEESIYQMLTDFGFKTIFEVKRPVQLEEDKRLTLVALK